MRSGWRERRQDGERANIEGTGDGLRRRKRARIRAIDTRPREEGVPVSVSAQIKGATTFFLLRTAVNDLILRTHVSPGGDP